MSISLDPNVPLLLLGLLVGWVGGCSLVDALLNSSSKREVLERYRTTGVRVAGCIVEHTRTVESSYYVLCPCLSVRTGVDYVVYYRYAYPSPSRNDPTAADYNEEEEEEEAEPSSVHTRYFHQGTHCADIEPLTNPCPVIVLPDVPTSGILQRDLDLRLTKSCFWLPHNSIPAFVGLIAGSFLTACGLLGPGKQFSADHVLASCQFIPVFALLGLPMKGRLLRVWKRRLMEDTVDARRFQGARYNRLPMTGTAASTNAASANEHRDKIAGPEEKPGSVLMEERGKTLPENVISEVV